MSTYPLLDYAMKTLKDLSANDRANLIRNISQIEGNTEFVAIYPTHQALEKAKQRVYKFNDEVAPASIWEHKGYEAGRATSGLLYVYAMVSEDQQLALGQLLRMGCKGDVMCIRTK